MECGVVSAGCEVRSVKCEVQCSTAKYFVQAL